MRALDIAYLTVTSATALANLGIAVADLIPARFVLDNSAAVQVPVTWVPVLGLLKGAGAVGLVLGMLGVPVIGVLAALCLTLFFVGAVVTHLRVGNHDLAFPLGFLALATGSLTLALLR